MAAKRVQKQELQPLPLNAEAFVEQLLGWYGAQGRELPWRNTRDAYRIWLAEIMLQQTTVATVQSYYRRFLAAFPTLVDLAAAPLEAVIDLWAGLGYYSRARNLHATAQQVVAEFAGAFPQTVAELQQLPGIGRSTAGAISALAYEQQAAILDGNVRRVLCRLCAWQQAPRSTQAEKQLWHWSQQLTPASDVHDYTQAIMDLGATVCLPTSALCDSCPVADLCAGRKLGIANQLPLKQSKKAVPLRKELCLLLRRNGRYLVQRRPADGFLGGLWEFPSLTLADGESAEKKLASLVRQYAAAQSCELGQIQHIYSHFRLQSSVYLCSLAEVVSEAEQGASWLTLSELETLSLHGAHKKVVQLLSETGQGHLIGGSGK